MKKIIKYGLMWITTIIITLIFLKLANGIGGYWINVSWAMAVWFGIETVLFLQIIEEWKEERKKNPVGAV